MEAKKNNQTWIPQAAILIGMPLIPAHSWIAACCIGFGLSSILRARTTEDARDLPAIRSVAAWEPIQWKLNRARSQRNFRLLVSEDDLWLIPRSTGLHLGKLKWISERDHLQIPRLDIVEGCSRGSELIIRYHDPAKGAVEVAMSGIDNPEIILGDLGLICQRD